MVRILLVEDEAAIRLLTRAKLKDRYEILEASDGYAALKVLDHHSVDLMIVDIMMPGMDGYEFVREVRGAGDMTPVIMLTAMSSFDHKKKGFASGIDDYLTKPINYEELNWHIEALLRRAKIANESLPMNLRLPLHRSWDLPGIFARPERQKMKNGCNICM